MSAEKTLEERIEELLEVVERLTAENLILRDEIKTLKKGLFGRRSERGKPGQLSSLGQGESTLLPNSKQPKKKKPGHGRPPFPPNLQRELIELDIEGGAPLCDCCADRMVLIGQEITERGHMIPARLVVKQYVRAKYGCPNGHQIKTADLPDAVIDGGKYEASVYANIVTSKYADHLPLHRLEGIFKRYGVRIPKQSMWDMCVTVDDLLAKPVLAQMRKELLEESVLHADETPITMRLENGKGTKKGYAWGWRNLHRSDQPSKALVEFRTGRGADAPCRFLGKWSGTLIADGYVGYDKVVRENGITRAGCYSHARRKIKEALETGCEDAHHLFELVQSLFDVERPINERVQSGEIDRKAQLEERRHARAQKSAPIITAIYAEAHRLDQKRSTLPGSKLGKAIGYLFSQRLALSAFLDDPRLPITNNDSERDLRHLAIGRNNWLVFGSERGGEVACRQFSLMLSCKQCGVNPEAYIEDCLMKVATTPASEIATLTPWAWGAAQKQS